VSERDEKGRQILGRSDGNARPVTGTGRFASQSGFTTREDLGERNPGSATLDDSMQKVAWRRRLGRPRVRSIALVVLAAILIVPVGLFSYGWWHYSRIETVDVSSVLSGRSGRKGTNYLIVGTDSRAGIDSSDPNAGAFIASEVSGARTDTIMILHVEDGTSQLASIPRDLWVTDPANGQKGRINSTFASGPANLILTVESIGIPVDHYLEINFLSFARLVDAVGGISVTFDNPARDTHSGLSIERAGTVRLNGSQALAYVRSRYYEEQRGGKWIVDPTSDLGRTERQRQFLTTLIKSASTARNPLVLVRLPGAFGEGIKRDTTLSYLGAIDLVWTMKDSTPASVAIPVSARTTTGGAAVLELKQGSSEVIQTLAK